MAGHLGDAMITKILAADASAAYDAPTGGEHWEDDEPTSIAAPSPARDPADAPGEVLAPLGSQVRPNGAVYHPRTVGDAFEDLALLRDAARNKEHVLLYGPPGTGKSALAEAAFAADATDEHDGLESIVGTADTTEADFVGTFIQDPLTGSFEWRPGPLHRSVMHNVPLLVDEIALIDPRVLSVLYPLMDGRGILRITMNPDVKPLPVSDNWFVIGAYNPNVPGAALSDALRDRFEHHIEVGSDWELARDMGVYGGVIELARNLDKLRATGEIGWSPQLRTLLSYARTEKRRGRGYALANLLSKAPDEDRDTIREVMVKKFGPVSTLRLGRRFAS